MLSTVISSPVARKARPALASGAVVGALQVPAIVLVGIGGLAGLPSAARTGTDLLLFAYGFAVAAAVRAAAGDGSRRSIAALVGRRLLRLLAVVVVVALLTTVVVTELVSTWVDGFGGGGWHSVVDGFLPAFARAAAHAWVAGLGAALAVFRDRLPRLRARTAVVLLPVGVVFVVLALALQGSGPLAGGALALLDAMAAALFLLAGPLVFAWSSPQPALDLLLRYVGALSWSLFCWFWPVLAATRGLLPTATGYAGLVAVCATVALAIATFEFVELPVWRLRLGSSPRPVQSGPETNRRRYAVLAIAAAAVLAVGAAQLRPTGQVAADVGAAAVPGASVPNPGPSSSPTRTPSGRGPSASASPAGTIVPTVTWRQEVTTALQATAFPTLHPSAGTAYLDKPDEWFGCRYVGQVEADRCTFPATRGGGRTVVVLGDSAAVGWLPAIRSLQGDGYTVAALDYDLCPAAEVAVRPRLVDNPAFPLTCQQHHDWALLQIARLKPNLVVLADSLDSVDRLASRATGPAAAHEWRSGLSETIRRVQAVGAGRVVILSPVPSGPTVDQCGAAGASPSSCLGAVSAQWHAIAGVDRALARNGSVRFVDVSHLFCDASGHCPAFIGDVPVHADGDLPTQSIVRALTPQLVPALLGS